CRDRGPVRRGRCREARVSRRVTAGRGLGSTRLRRCRTVAPMTWKGGQGIQFGESGQGGPGGTAPGAEHGAGEAACGLAVEGLIVSDQDWEATSMDRCPTCVEEVATPE